MDEILRAIADPIRRDMLARLADAELAAGELVKLYSISQPAVSQHLAVLRTAKLVVVRKDGRRRLYRACPEPLAQVDQWLAVFKPWWNDRLDALDDALTTLNDVPTSKEIPDDES